ncbi:putative ribonuclease H-like domain-containing protein [Tanacetum coccineum]
MSQPANDEFSQHLSDEESNHEDASDTGNSEWKLQEENFNWKGWEAKNNFTDGQSQRTTERFHGMMMQKEIWEANRTKGVPQPLSEIKLQNHIEEIDESLEHPLKNMVDRGIFDSGCSGHMTCNKDQLEDFEEFNGGSVLWRETLSEVYLLRFSKMTTHVLPAIKANNTGPLARPNNGTEFKNRDMLEFYGNKGIKQEYSNARTPQQNGVAERMNKTLIEAARTMLADSLLPTTFWAEAVSTACYIFNRVGYRWMFDIDYLTDSMNYIPVSLENQANPHAGISEKTNNAGTSQTPKSIASEEKDEEVELIVVPSAVKTPEEKDESRKSSTNSKKEETLTEPQKEKKDSSTDSLEDNPKIQAFRRELEEIALKHLGTVPENNSTSTPSVNTGSQTVNTGRLDHDDSSMPELEIFNKSPETEYLM